MNTEIDPRFEADLHARYRALDLREEELKREITLAERQLAANRELKERIAKQIFTVQTDSQTTINNGKHSTGSP